MSGVHCASHAAHGGYPTGVGMDCPGPNFKRDHKHTGNWNARDLVEGGGVNDGHSSTSKPTYVQRLTRVQGKKRDRDGYNGVEYFSRDCHNRPIPPLPGLPGPMEGL